MRGKLFSSICKLWQISKYTVVSVRIMRWNHYKWSSRHASETTWTELTLLWCSPWMCGFSLFYSSSASPVITI